MSFMVIMCMLNLGQNCKGVHDKAAGIGLQTHCNTPITSLPLTYMYLFTCVS